jgi:pyrimidine operon attenuation protein / uracil phosphoribosyltransferase
MQVLNDLQIKHKVKRLAYEILENNFDEKQIILAGINSNGYKCATLIFEALSAITDKPIKLCRISLNPAAPLDGSSSIDVPKESLKNKSLIIIDDVANTGRTIFFAFKVVLDVIPKKVEVAALVDRKHKLFPIHVDYVGLSLATTVKENIQADLVAKDAMQVLLV